MAQYQSFPNLAGDSKSLEKLRGLLFPDLNGKSFLDIGCNEGFFCGYAHFSGARRVLGIDNNRVFLDRAKKRFPECEFNLQGWDNLPDENFDVILLASALHYAVDQEELLNILVSRLTRDGVFILELGISPGDENEWVNTKRGIDTRIFPTMKKIKNIIDKFSCKYIGPSVKQSGDPNLRYVFHISKKKPYALLIMSTPYSGKTQFARSLFFRNKDIVYINGDEYFIRCVRGEVDLEKSVHDLISKNFSASHIDIKIRRLFESGLWMPYFDTIVKFLEGRDFIFDWYIPGKNQEELKEYFTLRGFVPVHCSLNARQYTLLPSERFFKITSEYYHWLEVRKESDEPN